MPVIPSLGPRGEGWVAIQGVLFVVIAAGGLVVPGSATAQPLAIVVGGALIVAGAILGFAGLVALHSGNALTAVPRPREGSRLVERGPYGLVRHPIYGALVIGALGWAVLRLSPAAALGAIALLVVLDLKRRREEVWLVERYAEYGAYQLRTRRMVPWIW